MKKRNFRLKIFIITWALSIGVMMHGFLFNVDSAPSKIDYAVILK